MTTRKGINLPYRVSLKGFRPITARDMSESEKRIYKKRMK